MSGGPRINSADLLDSGHTGAMPSRNAPLREELLRAYGATVPDLIAPDLRVLLVGINPSLWSGYAGYHFARPANRLWRTLHEAGFTRRRLHPAEYDDLLAAGVGITNLVARATARGSELTSAELRAGVATVTNLAERYRPGHVAFLGLSAYRIAFRRPRAGAGRQPVRLGASAVWLLPNPSGLNASYQQPALSAAYRQLREAAYDTS